MKNHIIIVVFISLFSCGVESPPKHSVLEVENKKIIDMVDLSTNFNKFSYQKLTIAANHFFKKIDKIYKVGNNFYLLGRSSNNPALNRLSIFDKKGSEVFSFSATDAQEILKKEGFIDDFAVHHNQLYLLLGKPQTILVFDPSNNIKKEYKLPFVASRLKKTHSGWVFYKTLNPNNLEDNKYFFHIVQTDNDFNYLKGYFPFQIKMGERMYFDINEPLGGDSQTVNYTACFNDTIYSLENNTIQQARRVQFETDIIRPENFKDIHQVSALLLDSENFKPFGISGFNETEKFVFFQVGQNASTLAYLKDKKRDKSYFFRYLKSPIGILPPPLHLSKEEILGVIDEESLSQIPDKLSKHINNEIYEKVVESSSIFIYHFDN